MTHVIKCERCKAQRDLPKPEKYNCVSTEGWDVVYIGRDSDAGYRNDWIDLCPNCLDELNTFLFKMIQVIQ